MVFLEIPGCFLEFFRLPRFSVECVRVSLEKGGGVSTEAAGEIPQRPMEEYWRDLQEGLYERL